MYTPKTNRQQWAERRCQMCPEETKIRLPNSISNVGLSCLAQAQEAHRSTRIGQPQTVLSSQAVDYLLRNSPKALIYRPPGYQTLTHRHFESSLTKISPKNEKREPSCFFTTDDSALTAKFEKFALQIKALNIGQLSSEIQTNLQEAIEDPNKLPSRILIELSKNILERILESKRYSQPGAKLCTIIIEKECTKNFLETLINTCQDWYQKRDKLRNIKAGDGTKFTAFMWFLSEMSCLLTRKQYQLETPCKEVPPELFLLTILIQCCQICVGPPIKSSAEIDCLFFVLTSIGKELEQKLPQKLEQLFIKVRDALLECSAVPTIKKTLLQLIELKASDWQLSGPAVLYYFQK